MTLLSIDPGRAKKASIGYCLFTEKGEEITRGEMTFEQLVWALYFDRSGVTFMGRSIYTIVIENFVNNAKSRGGQTNGTSECIGAVEYVAIRGETDMIRQPPAILPVAKLQAQYVDRLGHLPHQDSAYLHGFYYLVSIGVLQPKGLADTLKSTR